MKNETERREQNMIILNTPCVICGMKFKSRFHMSRHVSAHNLKDETNRVTCNSCGKKFKQVGQFWRHAENVHNVVIPPKYNYATFKCDTCDEEVCGSGQLLIHKARIHHIVTCICGGLIFEYYKQLDEHQLQTHARKVEDKIECRLSDECRKSYKDYIISLCQGLQILSVG